MKPKITVGKMSIRNSSRDFKLQREIGARIRAFRHMRKLSQETLAESLGVTFQQVQKYEYGTNALASSRVPDLCKALRIKPNELFDM